MASESSPASRGDGEAEWTAVREHAPPLAMDGPVRPRSDFRETIYWNPSLRTDASGRAQVRFELNDSITSFRAIAEGIGGGRPGAGVTLVTSKLPVSAAAQIPVEVTFGDVVRIPVTVSNTTAQPRDAIVEVSLGSAFKIVRGSRTQTVRVPPNRSRVVAITVEVVSLSLSLSPSLDAKGDPGRLAISVTSDQLVDRLERTVKIAPPGFPGEMAASGTLEGKAIHTIDLPEVVPGTLVASLKLFPTTTATLVAGTEALMREPGGCFEQASSTNYPNIMVLGYLGEHDALDPALVERSRGMLDRGYALLARYESPGRGYEWFGRDPGHEALTAYGLLEFHDMQRVYPKVDRAMVERTAAWLKAKRDGKGGFVKPKDASHAFGMASAEVNDAYVMWALTEVGERNLAPEIARLRRVAVESNDPYILSLTALSLANVDPSGAETAKARERLAAMQAADGSFPGAAHSITMSGGEALSIETTSLASLALMKDQSRAPNVKRAIDWIASRRNAYGGFASTQATVLALKALAAYAAGSRSLPDGATVSVTVNGRELAPIAVDGGGSEGISFPGIEAHLRPGRNEIAIVGSQGLRMPYSVAVTWRTEKPASSPSAPVSIDTSLSKGRVRVGDPVRLRARIANAAGKGLPMVIARIGIPGGLAYQPWQLEELRKSGKVDFIETREREVIVYFTQFAPNEDRTLDLDLLAANGGTYRSPASSAYLYYTDEHKRWEDPTTITIVKRPVPVKKKKQEVIHAVP